MPFTKQEKPFRQLPAFGAGGLPLVEGVDQAYQKSDESDMKSQSATL